MLNVRVGHGPVLKHNAQRWCTFRKPRFAAAVEKTTPAQDSLSITPLARYFDSHCIFQKKRLLYLGDGYSADNDLDTD